MTRVACIDIGTVTARLAVADVEDGHVARMVKQSTICNLGEGLTKTGAISRAAAGRVLDCVDGYLRMARSAAAPAICCTLTSAARDASNSDDLLGALAKRGLHAQVIPGEVEGSLTFLGVAQDFPGRRILVADSGGGSTELAVGRMSAAADGGVAASPLELSSVRSVNVGARRITEKFLSLADPPAAESVREARSWALEAFRTAVAEEGIEALAPRTLVTTGGTVTTLVALKLGLVPYDPRRVHLYELARADVDALLERLSSLTVDERAQLPGIQPKRASVILGGTVAISALMEATGFESLTASESDLLFGLALTAAAEREGKPSAIGWQPDLAALR